jgi:hypothetical protein
MKRKGTIVRYSIEEIRQMNREMGSGIDWDRVNAMTDEEIERNAREENRRLGFSDDWYKTATRVERGDGENSDHG